MPHRAIGPTLLAGAGLDQVIVAAHIGAIPAEGRPLALRLEGANEYDRIKGYHLAFGEFDPTDGLKGQSFLVDWGDGTSTKVEFDLYVVWKKNRKERIYEAEVHSPIRVDGAARGEGYYDAWIIRITR